MGVYARKIQTVGNRSFSVSLPKKWVIDNGLKNKNIVNIQESANNLIISANPLSINNSKIEIDVEDQSIVKELIVLCYVRAINELKLHFKDTICAVKSKPAIYEILKHLEGFKITDDSDNNITIKAFFGNRVEITINSIMRRMLSIINQMIFCIKNGEKTSMKYLEDEVDSLYHLSKRILYLCATDLEIRHNNNLNDVEEIFLWRLIFKKMETLGDIIEKIKFSNKNIEAIESILKQLNEVIILNKPIEKGKIESLDNIPSLKNGQTLRIHELVMYILYTLLSLKLNHQYFH